MTLQQRLAEDLKDSLRKGDKPAVSVIRLALAGIHNAEIAKGGPLDEGEALAVLSKEARQHQESIDAFAKGNRADLVAQQEAEMAVLKRYLPQQMSHQEIVEAVRLVIDEVGARSPHDKGKVMPKLMAQLRGKADGREINQVVTDLLSGAKGS